MKCGDERDLHDKTSCEGYDDYFPELGGGPPCFCSGWPTVLYRIRAVFWNHVPVTFIEWYDREFHKRVSGAPVEGREEK